MSDRGDHEPVPWSLLVKKDCCTRTKPIQQSFVYKNMANKLIKLTFYCSCSYTFDDVFLAEQVYDNNRDDTDHNHRHGSTQVYGTVASFQIRF